jgi:hypothetical protein
VLGVASSDLHFQEKDEIRKVDRSILDAHLRIPDAQVRIMD